MESMVWHNAMVLWSRGPSFEPMGGSKVDPAFHLSEVDHMNTRNSWELSGKKQIVFS